MTRIDQEQIEVARDAWQEDEGASERWRACLEGHPLAVQNYIGKRFAREHADIARAIEKFEAKGEEAPPNVGQMFRITSLTYEPDGENWAVTDNTPEGN